MRRYCGIIYKQAREAAGLTQEQASYLLPIPVRTLSSYENGSLVPSGELVCRMIEVYNAKWLWYLHLKNNDPVGKEFLPKVNLGRLSTSVLRLQKEMTDVNKIYDSVINIACDDKVSEDEKEKWKTVDKEVGELMSACVALMNAT